MSSEHEKYFQCPKCGITASAHDWGNAPGTSVKLTSTSDDKLSKYLSYCCPNPGCIKGSSGHTINEVLNRFEF